MATRSRSTSSTPSRGRSRRAPPAAPAPAEAPAPAVESHITVRVGRLPGRIHDVALNGGRTVQDAIKGAELDATGYTIKVNAAPATLRTALNQGDTVLLVKAIAGN